MALNKKSLKDSKIKYSKPKFNKFGKMSKLTLKSGASPDQQQPNRPKPGGGGG